MPKQKYNQEYIKYSFIASKHRRECLQQGMLCMKTLSNVAMKPSLLQQHLELNYAEKTNKDKSYFERLGENAKRQHLDKTGQFHQKKVGVVKA